MDTRVPRSGRAPHVRRGSYVRTPPRPLLRCLGVPLVTARDRLVAEANGQPARYVTPEELAGPLRCSLRTIYRLAESDPTVPVLRLGRLVRFPRETLAG